MKKIMLIAAFALMAMACNKVENIVENDKVISFNAEVAKGTKAPISGTVFPETQSFGVYSVNGTGGDFIMNNVNVVFADNKWAAAGEKKYYWPNDASTKLNFYAYSPYSTTNATFDNQDGIKFVNYANDFVTDLMVSEPAMDQTFETSGSGVELKFKHTLTNVLFTVSQDGAKGVNCIVKSIKMNSIPNTGTFTANTWSNLSNPVEIVVYEDANGIDVTGKKEQIGEEKLVIPQDVTTLTFEVVYDLFGESVATETVTKTIEFGNVWLANQKISYNLVIGMREITFKPSIDDWTPIDVVK